MSDGATCSQLFSMPRQLPEVMNVENPPPIYEVSTRKKRASDGSVSVPKRPRYFDPASLLDNDFSSSDDEDEDYDPLAEAFDPNTFYSKDSKCALPAPISKYIKTHFGQCLSKEVRKAMSRENPLPKDISCLKCPKMDDVLVDFMG